MKIRNGRTAFRIRGEFGCSGSDGWSEDGQRCAYKCNDAHFCPKNGAINRPSARMVVVGPAVEGNGEVGWIDVDSVG